MRAAIVLVSAREPRQAGSEPRSFLSDIGELRTPKQQRTEALRRSIAALEGEPPHVLDMIV